MVPTKTPITTLSIESKAMTVALSLLLVALTVLGIADAGYLTYNELSGKVAVCGAGFECDLVLTSSYAYIGPIPLAALGLFFYLTMFGLAIAHYLELPITPLKKITNWKKSLFKSLNLQKTAFETARLYFERNLSWMWVIFGLAIFGFLFSAYLVSLMAFVIGSWCSYCLLSAATSTLILIVSSILLMGQNQGQQGRDILAWKYRHLLKPILFLLDAETVHNTFTTIGKLAGYCPLTKGLIRATSAYEDSRLVKNIDGIQFPNPIGLSAGFDYNGELTQILPSVGFGFHSLGTITYEPYPGNRKPRLGRFPQSKALLVNKGLKNLGAAQIIKNLTGTTFHIPTGISIGSTNKAHSSLKEEILDILKSFVLFEASSLNHAYYELNISCPNTHGGEPFNIPHRLKVLLAALDRLNISRPVYVKFPIDQSWPESKALLDIIASHQIAGVIIGNLTKDRSNKAVAPEDLAEWQKRTGNLSGKPTWERSNQIIAKTRQTYGSRFTIIGVGGVFTGEDAAYKMALGADLIQLITGMIYGGPTTIGTINHYLANSSTQSKSPKSNPSRKRQ